MIDIVSKLSDWINAELNNRGWSQRELGRRSSLSGATISDVIGEKTKPTWELCDKIAKTFNVPSEDLFRLAGLLPALPGTDNATAARITELVKHLPDEEKRLVLEYVEWRCEKSRCQKSGV